jgi:D-aspartate ligase
MQPSLDVDLRRFRPERPPVLLLGGLDLLRPLHLAGIPTVVASPERDDPTFASRWHSGRCLLPSFKNREAVLEAMLAAGDALAGAVGRRIPLIYGDDDHLDLICDYRDRLAQRFLLLLNDPDIDRALMEKDRFEAVARARGIPVPRTYTWSHAAPDALADVDGPVIAKPKHKLHWDESAVFLRFCGGKGGKARIFENGRALMADRHARQLKDELTFQDYIPGDDRQLLSFHGVADENGELLASFIGRKIRTVPALTGASTFLELAHDEALTAFGREVVARAPLKGVFKIDVKRNERDGSFRVLEVNARYTLWHHLGARNGINLCQAAYDYLVDGKRPAPSSYRTTWRWLYFRLDYHAYRDLASRGELSFWGWALSLLLSRNVYHLFSWDDPGPMLSRCGHRLLSWARRALTYSRLRLRSWLSTAS